MSDDKKTVQDRQLDGLSGGRGIEGQGRARGHEPEVVGRPKEPEVIIGRSHERE